MDFKLLTPENPYITLIKNLSLSRDSFTYVFEISPKYIVDHTFAIEGTIDYFLNNVRHTYLSLAVSNIEYRSCGYHPTVVEDVLESSTLYGLMFDEKENKRRKKKS